MKVNLESVIFTDECRATLDGPDGWSRGWYDAHFPSPQRLQRQQVGGGIMFSARIINNEIVRSFKVKDGLKITAGTYTAFLKEFLLPWFVVQKENDIYARQCTVTCCMLVWLWIC